LTRLFSVAALPVIAAEELRQYEHDQFRGLAGTVMPPAVRGRLGVEFFFQRLGYIDGDPRRRLVWQQTKFQISHSFDSR
jgi:hypothetical protein